VRNNGETITRGIGDLVTKGSRARSRSRRLLTNATATAMVTASWGSRECDDCVVIVNFTPQVYTHDRVKVPFQAPGARSSMPMPPSVAVAMWGTPEGWKR
jgi:hypothetical protein